MGWTKEEKDGYILVKQENGAELGYSPQSGARLIEQDGFLFKDLAGGGQLLPYLDWRLSYEERAADLASRLSVEQIAGLMLYSNHQAIPATSYDVSLYNGKPYSAGEANPWDITDNQRRFITEDNLRHILVTRVGTHLSLPAQVLLPTQTLLPTQVPLPAQAPLAGAATALMQWLSIGRAADRANREEMRIMGRENMLSTRATASICIKFHLRRGPLS